MESDFEYSVLSNKEDRQQIEIIESQCFGMSPSSCQGYFERLGEDNFRILRKAGQVVGGLALYPMGQWFSGVSVPMTGIAAVGIAPEYRGTGSAYRLMSLTVQELHQRGIPISVLYPATQVLYRKVGYEQGGSLCRWELPTASINLSDRTLLIHRVDPSNYSLFETVYTKGARNTNGHLNRNQAIWENVVKPFDNQSLYAYLIGSIEQPEGYVIFTQHQTQEGTLIVLRDWVVLTVAATRRFWTALSDHRSQVDYVRWCGSLLDPFLLILGEQCAKLLTHKRWMLRIIDVAKALAAREYPLAVETELHLEVQDDLIAANRGKFCLNVTQGRGEVTKGGRGELKLDIRALAPLYTGLFAPSQLQQMGYLEATPEALSRATFLFSGTSPWMPDFF